MLQIETLRKIAEDNDHVILTQHSAVRLLERQIRYEDVIAAISGGEIIEQYPDDYPHPSCLILGFSVSGKYLHVVCGTDGEYLWRQCNKMRTCNSYTVIACYLQHFQEIVYHNCQQTPAAQIRKSPAMLPVFVICTNCQTTLVYSYAFFKKAT